MQKINVKNCKTKWDIDSQLPLCYKNLLTIRLLMENITLCEPKKFLKLLTSNPQKVSSYIYSHQKASLSVSVKNPTTRYSIGVFFSFRTGDVRDYIATIGLNSIVYFMVIWRHVVCLKDILYHCISKNSPAIRQL